MGYKVIYPFCDLQDLCHSYTVGDEFPRRGLNVTDKRIAELSGKNNKQGRPLIEEVVGVKEPVAEYSKTEINRMPLAELRTLASSMGVAGAEEMTGSSIKKELISRMGL